MPSHINPEERPVPSNGLDRTDALGTIVSEHRALAILRALARQPGGVSNHEVLSAWLDQLGIPSSRVTLTDCLDHLAARGLIAITQVQDMKVVEITRHGQEVGEGLIFMEGIARPGVDCSY